MALDVEQVAARLDSLVPYEARVNYALTLPQAEDEIVYDVNIICPRLGGNLIEWAVETPSGPQQGWSASFGGDHYNFRNRRLQETHEQWDRAKAPRAQFAELIPEDIARQLRSMAAEPEHFSLAVSESADEVTVSALRTTGGETDAELKWVFTASTMAPLRFTADYNPGAISSQQIAAEYLSESTPAADFPEALSEDFLRRRHQDAFTNYRSSNFAIEQMRGERLPAFSLRLADDSGRMTRSVDDPLVRPTAVVLMDASSALAPQLVGDVRDAIDRLPADADVIWACADRNPDAVFSLLGSLRPGETALIGAKSLAADCGAAALPVILICRPDASVADLLIGLNKDTSASVIQMLMKQ